MKETLERLLPVWGMENRQALQIYSSAWEINESYILKIYDDKEQLERNVKLSEILRDCHIPAAKTIVTKTGKKFVEHNNQYFLMSEKLQGSPISNIKDKETAWKMGRAIAQLHTAFQRCEGEVEFWDNSLLDEMKGWIRENLADNGWRILREEEYRKAEEMLEYVYDSLPKQLIHRDVHFGNFLFFKGDFSGYIDFDLSQRNIRIFDICYFLTGLLAEETEDAFTKTEWLEVVTAVISGYESIHRLSKEEKQAIPCVMACIEILFAAYFIGLNDTEHADEACQILRFVQTCENLEGNKKWKPMRSVP